MSNDFKQAALDYHALPKPGKIAIELTKPAETAAHLALAYSPGVAEPVREIAKNPDDAYRYTGKGNLVAVISNGTAILGLGDLGPLASKPVMEGKALLFKRFADIDSVDIEVDAESFKSIPHNFMVLVYNLLGCDAFIFSFDGNRNAVFIASTYKKHIFTFHPKIPHINIGRDVTTGQVSDMYGAICVWKRGGYGKT